MSDKCIVKDCENHKHQGLFVGDLCGPCHQFITEGIGKHSQAYRNTIMKGSNEMKPHKHAELIKAWADGAEIEEQTPSGYLWRFTSHPSWNLNFNYRIKPKDHHRYYWADKDRIVQIDDPLKVSNLRLIFDEKSGILKSAETLIR